MKSIVQLVCNWSLSYCFDTANIYIYTRWGLLISLQNYEIVGLYNYELLYASKITIKVMLLLVEQITSDVFIVVSYTSNAYVIDKYI